jgi:transcriptional regulator with XRE-family HTH domain
LWPIGRGAIGQESVLLLSNHPAMVSQEQVGKTIVRLRKQRGLSQEKFALEAGIDRRYLSDIENGKRNVSFEVLNRVASYFNISLSFFIEEAERPVFFNSVEELREYLLEQGNDETTFFTNPDYIEAIVGVSQDGRLVYSYKNMVNSLVLRDNISIEEAMEFIDYNTLRTLPYMGDYSPVIVYNASI